MNCNGKCYLKKQLKQQEQQEQQIPLSKKTKIEVQVFNVPQPMDWITCLDQHKTDYSFFPEQGLASFSNTIFHPPSA